MPELPEVEVVRRSLDNHITGLVIDKVRVLNRNLRFKIPKNFNKLLINQKIMSIRRKGKYLIIKLQNKKLIVIHLGMTGKIIIKYIKSNSTHLTSFYYDNKLLKKHNHFFIRLNKTVNLIYNDIRKFGFIKILGFSRFDFIKYFSSLGPEPLSKAFNKNYLSSKCKQSKKKIKNFLMDQKYVSGLGNIYVNEILFYSSINPRKLSNKLSGDQINKIVFSTKKILKKAIQLGGSSIRDFNTVSGKEGSFQEKFKVYDRVKKSCFKRKCKGTIKKIYISNRSTFFCPKCQNN